MLGHRGKDWYDWVACVLVLQTDMVEYCEHTQIIAEVFNFNGQVGIAVRRMKSIYEPSVKLQSTDAIVFSKRDEDRRGGGRAELDGSSFPSSGGGMGWRREEERRSGSSRREQGVDGSDREGGHEPDTGTAFAEISESLDFDTPKERDGRVSISSEHSLMAVGATPSLFTYRKDIDEKCDECKRAGTAKYIIAHRWGREVVGRGS